MPNIDECTWDNRPLQGNLIGRRILVKDRAGAIYIWPSTQTEWSLDSEYTSADVATLQDDVSDIQASIPSIVPGTYDAVTVNDNGFATAGQAWSGSAMRSLFQQSSSVTVANTVTPTTLLGSATGSKSIPANTEVVGRTVTLDMWGIMSCLITDSLTFAITCGGVALASGAGIGGIALTNRQWHAHFTFNCRQNGATGNMIGQGFFEHTIQSGADLAPTRVPLVMTAVSSAIDFTADAAINATCMWSAASASDTITCTNADIHYTGQA